MNRILIPTDFSPVADNALAHGVKLAAMLRHRICLLHVNDDGAGPEDPATAERNREELKARKLKFEPGSGVKIETLIRKGNLFKAVNAVSGEIVPRLMVLGTHGKQGLQHLFGSYALRMVLDAPCPVLVVHDRPFGNGYRRILLPVTATTDVEGITGWLRQFARLSPPEVLLFHPIEDPEQGGDPLRVFVTEIVRIVKKMKLASMVAAARAGEDFSRQVIAQARDRRCDLIIAMTLPDTEATGYALAEWTEQLMFNPYRLPVLFAGEG